MIEPDELYSPFDRFLALGHSKLFMRRRAITSLAAWIAYGAVMLLLGSALGVSANYFILVPVIATAVAFGFAGGLISGLIGLPANLLFFSILGHPEFSPASKPIAEVSGIVLGCVLGYLSDYYRKLEAERVLRKEMESELRRALRDKETLFRELHHRVKNSLNLVKSLIRLQSRRSDDPAFKHAAGELASRIMSISLVHEQLYGKAELSSVDIDDYLNALVHSIEKGSADPDNPPIVTLECTPRELSMDTAVPLGLIVNEALTNAFKHGSYPGKAISVRLRFTREAESYLLEVDDNGKGFPGGYDSQSDNPEQPGSAGLGLTLIDLLTGQLGGQSSYRREKDLTVFQLRFPAAQSGNARQAKPESR